jgi:hypothetical protein
MIYCSEKTKIKTNNKTGGMAQVEEHLLSKCEALNSNSSTNRKRERERERERQTEREGERGGKKSTIGRGGWA